MNEFIVNEKSPASRTRLTRRWWFWVAAGLGLLALGFFTSVLVICQQGQLRLREVQAALRAYGLLTTPEELYRTAPNINPARIAETNARLKKFGGHIHEFASILGTNLMSPFEAKSLSTAVFVVEPDMIALEASLSRGELNLSSLAWLPHGVPDPTRLHSGGTWIEIPSPDLLGTCSTMYALGWSALIDPQHRQRFASTLAMSDIHRPANNWLEAMTTSALEDIDDEFFLIGILTGIVPDEICHTWLDRPATALNEIALGFQGERIIWMGQWAGISTDPFGAWRNRSDLQPGTWELAVDSLFLAHDSAIVMSYQAACEQRLRGRSIGKSLKVLANEANRACIGTLFSLRVTLECGDVAVDADIRHRVMRLAALACRDHLSPSGLPIDHTAFLGLHGVAACAAQGDLPALRYEKLGPARFRIGVDSTGPFTDLVPAVHEIEIRTGKPASTDPLVIRPWSIEMDVDRARESVLTRLAAISTELASHTSPP